MKDCPTCKHTMKEYSTQRKLFWCANCGTIKAVGVLSYTIERPHISKQPYNLPAFEVHKIGEQNEL